MKKLLKFPALFLWGGIVYLCAELLWRHHTHWTMGILGGLCFVGVGLINELIPWEWSILKQSILGAAIITLWELAAGIILNCWLHLEIWDYSNMPLNVWGQICLPYSLLWIFLSIPAILMDDWIRWKFFGEEKPHYTWFKDCHCKEDRI